MMSQTDQDREEVRMWGRNKNHYKADELVKKFGKKLIGRVVVTQAMGSWPGGEAIVIKVGCKDPLIEMFVKGNQVDTLTGDKVGEIGVFSYEDVLLTRRRRLNE